MRNCKACGKPVQHRLVFVTWEEGLEQGPYGRDCARKVVDGLAAHGITATRRREYVHG